MIHYHGTPLTPYSELEKMKGRHFCVSFERPDNINWCIKNSQSLMLDNGAFSAYTRGASFDKTGYYKWLDDKLYGMNWAVVPDVIGGTVEDQVSASKDWPYPNYLSAYVWHMDLGLDYLKELVQTYPKICFGSSGKYWKVNSPEWQDRADEAWEVIDKTGSRPWVHMMRGLRISNGRWPFASADSTNIARNFKNKGRVKCPEEMAKVIDSVQTPYTFRKATND